MRLCLAWAAGGGQRPVNFFLWRDKDQQEVVLMGRPVITGVWGVLRAEERGHRPEGAECPPSTSLRLPECDLPGYVGNSPGFPSSAF